MAGTSRGVSRRRVRRTAVRRCARSTSTDTVQHCRTASRWSVIPKVCRRLRDGTEHPVARTSRCDAATSGGRRAPAGTLGRGVLAGPGQGHGPRHPAHPAGRGLRGAGPGLRPVPAGRGATAPGEQLPRRARAARPRPGVDGRPGPGERRERVRGRAAPERGADHAPRVPARRQPSGAGGRSHAAAALDRAGEGAVGVRPRGAHPGA